MAQFEALLRRAMQQNEVVSVHFDKRDYESVYCGYVESINAHECRLHARTRYGMLDGWTALRLEDILLVDIGGEYEHRIAYFAASGERLLPFTPLERIEDGSIIHETLRQAKELNLIVKIRLIGDTYYFGGFVHSLSEEEITIAEYDTFGTPNGMTTVQLDQLLYVTCGSIDCQRTQHLVEHQQEFLEFRKEQIK